jgi:hypothetical protein
MSKNIQTSTSLPKGFRNAVRSDMQANKFVLYAYASAATSVGGFLTTPLPTNPSSAANWAEISTYYDEFRVLAMRLRVLSAQQYSVTAINNFGILVFDNDDSSALASSAAALAYGEKVVMPSIFQHTDGRSPTFMFRRPVTKDSPIPWVDCAVPTNSLGAIKPYFDGLTASTTYFSFYIEYFIEARGRR